MKATARQANVTNERTFERLTLAERAQHWVLIASFTTLVVTGLPARYHESAWAGWLIMHMGGAIGRALLHRVAAVMLMGLAVFHLFFLVGTPRGRFEIKALLPGVQDAIDAVQHLGYYLGLTRKHPCFGRFSYIEKFEYLAIIWGTIVMASTGLLLWFEVQAMRIFPLWVLDICRVVHSYEGLLAFLAIFIWHFYCVHFNPDVFPMSRIWLNGRITESALKHHHPREHEEIMRREQALGAPAVESAPETREPVGAAAGKGKAR